MPIYTILGYNIRIYNFTKGLLAINIDLPFVQFHNIQKSFDGKNLVVKNLNLEIKAGEFLTLLGPSGSGKTTCLMMLAGFESATHGQISLNGRPINDVAPNKRGIGMVFQNYALFPHMSVFENLAFPLQVRHYKKSEIKERVERVLDMVELKEFGDRRPAQLSGGQQQRVAVARALVFDPELVLMDEPLGALDKQLREQMQYEIKRIHNRLGVTIIYVTHDQSEALTMSDRVAVFNDGVIQQLSSPDELYERPQNSFVAQFIGENNKLSGTIKSLDGEYCSVQLASGDTIKALAINVAGVGSHTTLSLRPERVLITDNTSEMVNTIQGEILELIYLGDHIRAILSIAGSKEFIVKLQNSTDHKTVKKGDKVTVGWHAKDCRALDPIES